MSKIFCLCLLICFLGCFSQNAYQTEIKEEAQKFSLKGNKAFRKEKYKEADSLFSISLSIDPNSEIYRSRAFSRKALLRYNDFCDDLALSFKYGDLEAGEIFNKECIVGNTFFQDSLMKKSTGQDKYFSLNFIKYKYRNQQEYFKKNKKNELIEGYRINENDTLFYYIIKGSNYSSDINDLIEYVSKNLTYPQMEFTSGISGTVYTEIEINEAGKIVKTKILSTPSKGLELETKRVLMNAPFINPFIYKGRLVKSIMQFPVNFTLK